MVKRHARRRLAPPPAATMRRGKGGTVAEGIGHKLRAMFDDVVAEPVPEKFRTLLEELERKSSKT